MTMRWDCPHCGGACRVRTSRQLHSDYRIVYLQCQDPVCGWCGKGEYCVIETTSPSGMPNDAYQERLASSVPYQRIPTAPEATPGKPS